MSNTPTDLPDWLRDDDDPPKQGASSGKTPPVSGQSGAPSQPDDDLPAWLRGDDDAPARDNYLDDSGVVSAAFLAKGDALPDKVDLNLTFDQWQALQKDKARPRDIEEEIPDFSDVPLSDADPALKQTGQLPDWFLGLEEIDEEAAPAWFTDSKPKVTGTLAPPPSPPPAPDEPDDLPPWLSGMAVPQTGGLAALEPLEDEPFSPPNPTTGRLAQTDELPDYGWMVDAAANISAATPRDADRRGDTPSMDDLMASMALDVPDESPRGGAPRGNDDAPDMAWLLADMARDDGSLDSDSQYDEDADLPATGMLDDDYPDSPRFDTAMLRSMIPGAPKFANQPPPSPKSSPPPPTPDAALSGATAPLDADPEMDWMDAPPKIDTAFWGSTPTALDDTPRSTPQPPADDDDFDAAPRIDTAFWGAAPTPTAALPADDDDFDGAPRIDTAFWGAAPTQTAALPADDDDFDGAPRIDTAFWGGTPTPTDNNEPEVVELDDQSSAWLSELENIVEFAVRDAGGQTQKLPSLEENLESWGFGADAAQVVPELDADAFDSGTFDLSGVGTTGILPDVDAPINAAGDDFAFPELDDDSIPGLQDAAPAADEPTFDWLMDAGTITPDEPPAAVTESRSRLTGMLSRFNAPEPEAPPAAPVSDSTADDDLFGGLNLDAFDVAPAARTPANSSLLGAWTLDDVTDADDDSARAAANLFPSFDDSAFAPPRASRTDFTVDDDVFQPPQMPDLGFTMAEDEDAFQPPQMPDLGFEMVDSGAPDLFGDLDHEIRREVDPADATMDWESVVRSRALRDNEIIFDEPLFDDAPAAAPSGLDDEPLYAADELDSSLDVESLMQEGAALDLSTSALTLPADADELDMNWLRDDLFGSDSTLPDDAVSAESIVQLDEMDAEIESPSKLGGETGELFALFEQAQAAEQAAQQAALERLHAEEELPALDDLTWAGYTPAYTPSDVDKIDTGALRPPPEGEDVSWMLDAFGDEVEAPSESDEDQPAIDWLTQEISDSDNSSNMFEPDMLALAGAPEIDDAIDDAETIAFESQMPPTPSRRDDAVYGDPTTFDFFAEPPAEPAADEPAWLQDISDLQPDLSGVPPLDDAAQRRAFVLPLDMARDLQRDDVAARDELPDDLDVLFGSGSAPSSPTPYGLDYVDPQDERGFNEADLLSAESIRDLNAYLSALEPERAPQMTVDTDALMTRTDIDLDAVLIDTPERDDDARFAPPTTPGVPGLAPANVDWLNQLQASVSDVSAGALVRQMQDQPVEELTDRLQKLRDLADDIPNALQSPANDPLEALLPGVADALVPAPSEWVTGAPSLESAPSLSPEQGRNAALLRTLAAAREGGAIKPRKLSAIELTYDTPYMEGLLDSETSVVERPPEKAPPAPTPRRPSRVRARGTMGMSIERIIIVVILAAAVILPFLMPAFRAGTLPPTAFPPGGAADTVYGEIEALPPGALVLIGVEYSTASSAELDGLTDAILRHVFLRGAIPVIVGGNPVGVLHVANQIESIAADRNLTQQIGVRDGLQPNRDYYIVRYLPGSALGLRAFSGDSAALLLTDINGQATGLGVRSLQDFSLIAIVTDRAEDVRAYAEQVAPLARMPIIAAVSYSAAPLVEPYFIDSPTMRGLLVGYGDAYTYGGLIGGVAPFARDNRALAPLLVGPTPTRTPTITPTFTASPTPSPTRDPDASNTPTHTLTPPPTSTPAPLIGIVTASGTINVRAGAGTTFDIVTTLAPGAQVEIIGNSADNAWLNVRTQEGVEGWVSAQLMQIEQRTTDARKEGESDLLKPFRADLSDGRGDPILQDSGEVEPTATRIPRTSAPSATPFGFVASRTPIPTRANTATNTRTPVPSATPIPSRTPSPAVSPTIEATDTRTPVPSATPIPSRTPSPAVSPTIEATDTPRPTRTPSPAVEATDTPRATRTPSPAVEATDTPRATRTPEPTDAPPTDNVLPAFRTLTALPLTLTAMAGDATNTPRPSRTPADAESTPESTPEGGGAGVDATPDATPQPPPDIAATVGAALQDFGAGLTIDETPSAGYRDERWYAQTGGVLAAVLIIGFGTLINVIRAVLRAGRGDRATSTRRRRP
jgi:hypothetical protein